MKESLLPNDEVRGLEDILDELGPLPQSAVEPTLFSGSAEVPAEPEPAAPRVTVKAAIPLSERQCQIVAHLSETQLGVDQLIERTGLEAHVVLQELTWLSLRGVIKRVDGQTYARA